MYGVYGCWVCCIFVFKVFDMVDSNLDSFLDRVLWVFGFVCVDVLGKIVEVIFGGFIYFYLKYYIMYCDIKFFNIFVNLWGFIKFCDFGVFGEFINLIVDIFVGMLIYMVFERI